MVKFKFLKEGALIISTNNINSKGGKERTKENTLVIGDLHIGIETDFASGGITIPFQTEKVKQRIDKIIKSHKITHLIFLGDVRHKLPLPSRQEQREVPEFLSHFANITSSTNKRKIKVSIVKGNHDGQIELIAPKKVKVYPSAGFIDNEILFTHGRNKPMKGNYNTIIMSHIHPSIEFWSSGIRMIEHCWVRTKTNNNKEIIILPSFTYLKGGSAINSERFKAYCPILKNADFDNSEIFLLDGTFLGKLKDLKIQINKK
jgi:uncharacterized protein